MSTYLEGDLALDQTTKTINSPRIDVVRYERLLKTIANWKRLVILDALIHDSKGKTYTHLSDIIAIYGSKENKRIDFHLDELQNTGLVTKKPNDALGNNAPERTTYHITHHGRLVNSLVTTLLELRTILESPENGLLVFQDSIKFDSEIDMMSLAKMLSASTSFMAVWAEGPIARYWVISEQLQIYPPLRSAVTFIELWEGSKTVEEKEIRIKVYWSCETGGKERTGEEKKVLGSLRNDQNMKMGLMFIVQQTLAKIREAVYKVDILSTKAINDRIYEYIADRNVFGGKIPIAGKKEEEGRDLAQK